MLKRKVALFFTVIMIGVVAGGNCFMPNVLASGTNRVPAVPGDDSAQDSSGDNGNTDSGETGGDTSENTDSNTNTDSSEDTNTGTENSEPSGNSEDNTSSSGDGNTTEKPSTGTTTRPGSGSGSTGTGHSSGTTSGNTGSGTQNTNSSTAGTGSSSYDTNTDEGDSEDTETEVEASESDSMLQSLTFSSGILSPKFDSSTYEYTLTLDSPISSLVVNAVAFNIYSTVEGDGKIPLTADRNQIVISCTDVLGNTKKYVIHLTGKAFDDSLIMENYRYIDEFEEDTIPESFVNAKIKVDDNELNGIHSDKFNVDAICMADQEEKTNFYIVSNGKVTSQSVIILQIQEKEYLLMPVNIDLKLRSGFTWTSVQIGKQMVTGWKYNDGEENFFQMYLRNENQEDYIYQYDVTEQTLQKFNDDLIFSSSDYEQAVKNINKSAKRKNIKYTVQFLILILAGGGICTSLVLLQHQGGFRKRRKRR